MAANNLRRNKISHFLINNIIYIVLVLIFIIIVIIEPNFLSIQNFWYILSQSSTKMIMALGCAGIIVLGGTDLSIGRMIGMTSVVTASLLQSVDSSRRIFAGMPRLPIFIPILLAMVLCILFSTLNGIAVMKLKIAPFIASLAVGQVVYGMMSLYFEAANSGSPIGNLDPAFTQYAQGGLSIFGFRIPYIILYAIAVVAIVWTIWNKTQLGKNMFAIGGNSEAAAVSGVNIVKNGILVYVIAGLLYAFAGSLEVARTGSATNGLGQGYELDAIASCVVGGVSMRGGIGSISGVVTGVLLFQVINYGLVYISVSPYLQYVIKGLIILIAVGIDTKKYIKQK